MALEDPRNPGVLHEFSDPFLDRRAQEEQPAKKSWTHILIGR
jgi:hypothetical protein